MGLLLAVGILGCLWVSRMHAEPVGETHRVISERLASLRDAKHRDQLRVTVWYPAVADAIERVLVIGPPAKPMFDVGAIAPDAPFTGTTHPVILLSHGFGGTARIMGWFGIAMARAGYVVVAVDHPGNNGMDEMTVPGAILWWDRAEDLRAALDAMERDRTIGPHIDASRIGVAGFSAGGFTALVAAGARVDPAHLSRFCQAHPDDGVCRPQQEFSVTPSEIATAFASPEVAAEEARATEDHSISGVRAAFAMAPALVQALNPSSLARMHTPVLIVLGDADTVAPPSTNGLVAAKAIPGAELVQLPGVGHYDFRSTCTKAGQAAIPQCKKITVPQADTHRQAIKATQVFFARSLNSRQ